MIRHGASILEFLPSLFFFSNSIFKTFSVFFFFLFCFSFENTTEDRSRETRCNLKCKKVKMLCKIVGFEASFVIFYESEEFRGRCAIRTQVQRINRIYEYDFIINFYHNSLKNTIVANINVDN